MRTLCFVSMSADANSTFEVNDINELSKFYKNIFLFPLIKDRFKKYKPPYKKNIILQEINLSLFDIMRLIFTLKFLKSFIIIFFSRDDILDKIKQIILIPKSISIANSINSISPDHIHLFWGHYPSLVLVNLESNIKTRISMFLGAYDLRKKLKISELAAKKSHIVFTHVKKNIKIIKEFTKAKDVKLIYRGLKSSEFSSSKIFKKDPLLFCTIGLLEKHKNIDKIILTFKSIKKKFPSAKLFIIGTGSQEINLKNLASKYDLSSSVRFLGWVKRKVIHNVMSRANFYLHFSKMEALPNSIKEAMYNKCFVISSKTFGIDELIKDKVNGYIVDPNNTKKILKIINNCLANKSKINFQINKKIIEQKYNLKKNIFEFVKTVKNIDIK